MFLHCINQDTHASLHVCSVTHVCTFSVFDVLFNLKKKKKKIQKAEQERWPSEGTHCSCRGPEFAPSIYTGWLITTCMFRSRASNAFWSPWASTMCAYAGTGTHTDTHGVGGGQGEVEQENRRI